MDKQKRKPAPLSLLCVVCDWEKQGRVLSVLEGHRTLFSLALHGKGTANSRMLSYLGLGSHDKLVLFNVTSDETAGMLLAKLDDSMDFKTPGHGIAFSADMHEGCYHRIVDIDKLREGADKVNSQATHDLIMVVLNRGYTEEVMDAARAAGATGGTVLHARGCGLTGAEKFFGVTIQPEKEVVMIVAQVEDSCGIMQAIADEAGPEKDANAVSFSMPLSAVAGIGGAPKPQA